MTEASDGLARWEDYWARQMGETWYEMAMDAEMLASRFSELDPEILGTVHYGYMAAWLEGRRP